MRTRSVFPTTCQALPAQRLRATHDVLVSCWGLCTLPGGWRAVGLDTLLGSCRLSFWNR